MIFCFLLHPYIYIIAFFSSFVSENRIPANQQVMKDEDNKPQAKRRGRRPAKHRSGFYSQENRDIASSLEHLIATGSKLKHDMERRKEFRIFQEILLEQQHSLPWTYVEDDYCSEEEIDNYNLKSVSEWAIDEDSHKPPASTKVPKKHVLQEDIRIYGEVGVGKEGFAKSAWPKQQKKYAIKDNRKLNNSDKNWEIEHGDSIHSLAFAAARLSESIRPKTAEELKAINGHNLNVSTTDTAIPEEDVPRALLLRCWERAVHSASTAIPVRLNLETQGVQKRGDVTEKMQVSTINGIETQDETSNILFGNSVLGLGEATNQAPIGRSTPAQEPSFAVYQRCIAIDRTATEAKCASLGVGIPRIIQDLTCPICCQVFENSKLLRAHYYGGSHGKGCCWKRISEKGTEVISNVLETHVKSQIDGFIGLVMARAKDRMIEPGDGQRSNKRRRLLNWHDILKFAEKTMHSSHQIQESELDHSNGIHPLFETLQYRSNSIPLLLNPALLHTIRRRLVDRYAKLPT